MPSPRQILHALYNRFFGVDLTTHLCAQDLELLDSIRNQRLTYLTKNKLAQIAKHSRRIEEEEIPGRFIEAGCALGGSAIMIAKLKKLDRCLHVYDVFDMIPPPSEEDGHDVYERYKKIEDGNSKGIGGDQYYGYESDLFNKVKNNFNSFDVDLAESNVELIKGLVQDTMSFDGPVALAHIDVDWFDPVMHCLTQIVPNLSVGGSVILDDYYDWSGCRKATDEFFQSDWGRFERDASAGSLCFTRVK
jgi:asparagine synthase (glutamine-hydrolysing)